MSWKSGNFLRILFGSAYWERLNQIKKMGERVETASCGFLRFPAGFCSFLRLQTTYLADQGLNLQKSAKIFDKLPFLPFSLSHLALPNFGAMERKDKIHWRKSKTSSGDGAQDFADLRWPCNSQRESGRFARIDSQKKNLIFITFERFARIASNLRFAIF